MDAYKLYITAKILYEMYICLAVYKLYILKLYINRIFKNNVYKLYIFNAIVLLC